VFDRVHIDEAMTLRSFFSQSDLEFLSQHLTTIDQKPSYAGSFAAVFNATTREGQIVIVKVLRPEIRKTLKRDLRHVVLVAKPLSLFNEEIKLALQGTLKLFRQTTLRENQL